MEEEGNDEEEEDETYDDGTDVLKILSDGKQKNPVILTDDNFIDIARVEPGGSFGALALIQGKKRMGTTKALNRVHLIVLNRQNWKNCEKEIN